MTSQITFKTLVCHTYPLLRLNFNVADLFKIRCKFLFWIVVVVASDVLDLCFIGVFYNHECEQEVAQVSAFSIECMPMIFC